MTAILLHEVGPRDGLQAEARVVPTETKLEWLRILANSGLDMVQVGSFVRGDKMPQMADTDELFRILSVEPHTAVLSGLVLNEKGLERGLACGVELFCLGVSASDTHSKKNTGMGTAEAQARIIATAQEAVKAGKAVQVSVQSAFGCGFEGRISESRVLEIVRAYLDAGLTNISLADTAGHAYPAQVKRLFSAILAWEPTARYTAHFHDTYGLGMANTYAAWEAGARCFETSFAGLGGCPFTKVAAGNVATEDLVHGLHREGLRPDVNLASLVDIAQAVARFFGREMPGRVHHAGILGY
ncbi:MAG: hydroxymethylglutaryl-CoA lyase [Holophaga sp.]|nr:hydroxymethylglutaryl-CoA lyase [Holophaga sp.]